MIDLQRAQSQAFCSAFETYAVLARAVVDESTAVSGVNQRLAELGLNTRLSWEAVERRVDDKGAAVQTALNSALAELQALYPETVAANFALPANAFLMIARKPVTSMRPVDHVLASVELPGRDIVESYEAMKTAHSTGEINDDELEWLLKAWLNNLYEKHRRQAVREVQSPLAAVELKPSFFGLGIDVKILFEQVIDWWRRRDPAED